MDGRGQDGATSTRVLVFRACPRRTATMGDPFIVTLSEADLAFA
jgi:hypothetical protein